MRLVIIGADGQVGWELRKSLATLGEVVALNRAQCDLTRPAEAARIVTETKPGVIVNAAAYTAVDAAEREEALATLVNATAVGELAAAACRIGALFIHYSTDYVFDGTKLQPYTEDDRPNPLNAYGRSKLAGERAVEQSGGDYLVLRTSWVYAVRGQNFLNTVLRLAREGASLRVVDDQIGAPTWARQLADATAVIARRAIEERGHGRFTPGIFHLTASGATSWFHFASAIVREAMRAGVIVRPPAVRPIASADYPTIAARPKNSRLASDRARHRFGVTIGDWRPALVACLGEAIGSPPARQ